MGKILLTLADDLIEEIDKRVKRGNYTSPQELIREILRREFPRKV